MPWTSAQHRLFEAAAHDPSVAKRVGIPQGKASQMASEGIKKNAKSRLSAALRGKHPGSTGTAGIGGATGGTGAGG